MPNIVRRSTLDDLDDLFKGFFVRPATWAETPAPVVQLKMDVHEDEAGYSVHAEIPGVKKEDIHVHIDGNMVSIAAEVKNEKEVKDGETLLRSERYYGKVSRSFQLGHEVDEASSSAKYADGVLVLRLRKRAAASKKKISVQ